jgi:hypothetical protein
MPDPVTTASVLQVLTHLVGEPIREGSGWLADIIHQQRLRLLLGFVDEYDLIRSRLGISGFRPVPPKLAIPILNAASLEDDDYVRNRYACLMANFTDPAFKGNRTPAFTQLLGGMSPEDLQLLRRLYLKAEDSLNRNVAGGKYIQSAAYVSVLVGMFFNRDTENIHDFMPSIGNLVRLNCMGEEGMCEGLEKMATPQRYVSTPTLLLIKPLGEELLLACEEDIRRK